MDSPLLITAVEGPLQRMEVTKMRGRKGAGSALTVLLGLIAISATLAAALFPAFGAAHRKAHSVSRASNMSQPAATAPMDTPFATYDGIRSALADSRGRALTLASVAGTPVPALKPV